MPAIPLDASDLPDLSRKVRAKLRDEAAVQHEISRRALLRGTFAAVLAGTVAPELLASPAAPAEDTTATKVITVDPALSPLELDFSIVEQFRPFDILPRRFTQVREWFNGAAAARYAAAGLQAEGRTAEVSPTGRALRIRSSTAAAPTLFRAGFQPVAPYATAIVTTDTAAQGSGGEAAVVVGLVRDARNYVVASFDAGSDAARGTVSIDVVTDGRGTRPAFGTADLTGPARLAFVANENYVTALVGDATSWTPVTQHRITDLLDLRDPGVLRDYWYGFGAGGAHAVVDVTGFEAGHFGGVGIRDPHVVSHSDGTPFIRNNKLYFTATQAGLAFQQAAHWGVWTPDLEDPSRIEHVAKLFFTRDGLVLGDHAGQIVVDERDGGFHIGVSGWGDFAFNGVRVHYTRSFADVLHGLHVLPSAPMPLPTDASSWDPSLVRIGDRWYVGFVESPYHTLS